MSWDARVLQVVLFAVVAVVAIGYGLTVDDRTTRWAVVGGGALMLAGSLFVVVRDARGRRD